MTDTWRRIAEMPTKGELGVYSITPLGQIAVLFMRAHPDQPFEEAQRVAHRIAAECVAEELALAHHMGYEAGHDATGARIRELEAALRAENERLKARVEGFRAFVGLVLEYCEKEVPYWYGEDLKTRARKLLEETPCP